MITFQDEVPPQKIISKGVQETFDRQAPVFQSGLMGLPGVERPTNESSGMAITWSPLKYWTDPIIRQFIYVKG